MKCSKLCGLLCVVAIVTMLGCSGDAESSSNEEGGKANNASSTSDNGSGSWGGHSHGAGPNGGVVFDLGKYHAEFTVDHGEQTCMILILGDDQKSGSPVAAEKLTVTTKETKTTDGTTVEAMTIELLPQDATDGKASTFVGSDPGIANVADFDGTVVGVIDDKPSQGEFSESHGSTGH